ncbi:MAG: sulfurtransferase TusA family protein [Gemmatimonadaceae bacterium]|nr:sulfurtransferase TusA family protein [Acetobacteraceae bacterium]
MPDTMLPLSSPDQTLDITGDICPMTFVRTRLALDRLKSGQTLLIRLRGEEPRRNVPRTATEMGHVLVQQRDHPDGTTELLLKKA